VQGNFGPQGLEGRYAAMGLQGPQGPFGIQGIQGLTGLKGDRGIQGWFGTQGILGRQGLQGISGADDITAGVGVTLIHGQINIGQPVATTSNVTFATVSHSGLITTSGTNVDQVITFTKSLTLSTDWQDVNIDSNDLATGTYIIQLYANDTSAGGTNINEYYSGIMSWYSGSTNSSLELPTDEVALHRAGASGDAGLYLRTFRSQSNNADALRLQIYSNQANASASNYIFKFRRVI
jgi:hypothetical protein